MTEEVLGERLTVLGNLEAKIFITKYDHILNSECRKRRFLVGMDWKDLKQECCIKLLSGFHLYDYRKSKEKTWVTNVIKKTLNGIWNKAMTQSRVNHIGKNGNKTPVRDLSFNGDIGSSSSSSPDYRPAFATATYTPEESLQIKHVLEFIKERLPIDTWEYFKEKLLVNKEVNIESNPRLNHAKITDRSEYLISNIVCGLEEDEIRLLAQTADFFVQYLDYDKEQIECRSNTYDIPL